jgi:hypothetical protein
LFIDAHVRILDGHVTDLDFFGHCCLLFNKRVLILLLSWLIILLLLVVNRYLQFILSSFFMEIHGVLVFSFG